MTKPNKQPKSPEQIMLERAEERRREKLARSDPAQWGTRPDQAKLQAFADVGPVGDYYREEVPTEDENGQQSWKAKDSIIEYRTTCRTPLFLSLAKCAKPMITERQAYCGWALVEIYARSVGKAGAPERPERVDGGELHRIPINGDTIQNGRRYLHLSASIPHGDPRKALQALCKAIVEHDGPIGWRQVVQAATGQGRAEVQAYIVRTALEALEEAFRVEVREEWARS